MKCPCCESERRPHIVAQIVDNSELRGSIALPLVDADLGKSPNGGWPDSVNYYIVCCSCSTIHSVHTTLVDAEGWIGDDEG